MVDQSINSRIKLKTDSELNWSVNNPVLLFGELAIVITDNGENKIKIGDGVSNYNDLVFFGDEFIEVTEEEINSLFDVL